MKKKMYYFIAVLVLLLIAWAVLDKIIKSDTFQKKHYPTQFWAEKISELKSNIKSYEWLLNNSILELKEIEATKELKIAKAVNLAKLSGKDPEEFIKSEEKIYQIETKKITENIEMYQKMLSDAQDSLDSAIIEYETVIKK